MKHNLKKVWDTPIYYFAVFIAIGCNKVGSTLGMNTGTGTESLNNTIKTESAPNEEEEDEEIFAIKERLRLLLCNNPNNPNNPTDTDEAIIDLQNRSVKVQQHQINQFNATCSKAKKIINEIEIIKQEIQVLKAKHMHTSEERGKNSEQLKKLKLDMNSLVEELKNQQSALEQLEKNKVEIEAEQSTYDEQIKSKTLQLESLKAEEGAPLLKRRCLTNTFSVPHSVPNTALHVAPPAQQVNNVPYWDPTTTATGIQANASQHNFMHIPQFPPRIFWSPPAATSTQADFRQYSNWNMYGRESFPSTSQSSNRYSMQPRGKGGYPATPKK
ncbi:hypothetical protein [Candidatus Cardinium hertigii]|uniref:Uncharacterized protein n=1 Tax=Candidatus Cardinium hertigii TaxID=247481 RepID=A0A3N2QDH9_9BACT|nr:hypothetical protein [Candidatus Cardinium hertigii]ROT47856.1 hypothetical protein EDM02_00055 [Candidatus Cardinium hertigii]